MSDVGAGGGDGTPPETPPSSPLAPPPSSTQPRYLTHNAGNDSQALEVEGADDTQPLDTSEPMVVDAAEPHGRPTSPLSPTSPFSPTSAASVSASAVSATEQPRYAFPEMSASIDATLTPRYLGRFGAGGVGDASEPEDDVEAELRRMAQRQLPRGDLGRQEWRLDTFTPHAAGSAAPSSPTSSIRTDAGGARQGDSALPRPPASPPSSPRSRSASAASRTFGFGGGDDGDDFSASRRSPATGAHVPAHDDENLSGAVVWGTNISVSESMALFRTFVHEFQLPGRALPHRGLRHDEGHYVQVLRHLALTQSLVLNLDTQHLLQFRAARKLYHQLLLFPQVLIRILDMVVSEEFAKLFPDAAAAEDDARLQVRPFNLSDLSPMRNLNPSDIDQLVCLKGMVTRCSAIIPDLKEAFFRCTLCHATAQVELDRGRIEEPSYCARCNARLCMELIHNRCAFTDKQLVKMQETPDAIPEGETPYTVMLFAFDDLVDDVRPGDKVEVTGIYRAVPLRASSRQRVVKSVFKTYIDVVHFRRVDELARRESEPTGGDGDSSGDAVSAVAARGDEDTGDSSSSSSIQATQDAKLREFQQIAAHPTVYENLAHSLAPSIWELDDVKKGILCMLFGGTRKDKAGNTAGQSPDGVDGALMPTKTMRSDMNVLLCGDPGTSKSQLLSYVHKLSPRSIYTSGKGSSAVGLTASIIRDMETGDLNVNILPTLLSRFDLIYLILDKPQPESDRKLAKHIVALYYDADVRQQRQAAGGAAGPQRVPMKLLTEYIAYAKKHVHPRLLPEARDALVAAYLDLRRMGSGSGAHAARKNITATPRQLESLIRIAEALAKMRLRETVACADVDEALRLMNVATQRAAMDPRTGTIDMDMINTGHSSSEREAVAGLVALLKTILGDAPGMSLTVAEARRFLDEKRGQGGGVGSGDVKGTEFQTALRALEDDSLIQISHGLIRYFGESPLD
ncbi:hypothetical protein PybrP1_009548 [[Pythium] brassicae (nom. inval.)]|nr:hypothetical protein PybrP1_009548 [[Pythium] brassicae (nom. inval.)]